MNIFAEMINDINHAIVADKILEEEENIEMLEVAMDNWKELIKQIHREKASSKRMAKRHELSEEDLLDMGAVI